MRSCPLVVVVVLVLVAVVVVVVVVVDVVVVVVDVVVVVVVLVVVVVVVVVVRNCSMKVVGRNCSKGKSPYAQDEWDPRRAASWASKHASLVSPTN